jgi:hypothetical protein
VTENDSYFIQRVHKPNYSILVTTYTSKLPRSCATIFLKILLEEAKTSIVSPRYFTKKCMVPQHIELSLLHIRSLM